MFNYIISAFIIIITFCLIYFINKSFEINKIEVETTDLLEVDILTDRAVIISRDGCPYCTMLDEELKKYDKSKYMVVKIPPTGELMFDDTFTDLEISERDNIIQEVTKVITSGTVYFPTLLVKNNIYRGLPSSEEIKQIFN